MLTREDNELVTKTGPGTPMGDVLRRYWIPAFLARELPEPDCPPVRVQLLGERLVGFRDSQGRIGLVDEFCRTAAPRCGSDATRNPACAASVMAGSSTSTAIASIR